MQLIAFFNNIDNMKKILLIIMVFIPLFGCSARNRSDLTYFRYSFGSTMRANGGEEWTVELKAPGSALVTIKEGIQEKSFTTGSKILDDINAIVNKHKMYRYKGSYRTVLDVRDGWAWGFDLTYSNGRAVSADGYMKYPTGGSEAFKEITDYIKQRSSIPDSSRMWAFYFSSGNGMVIHSGEAFEVLTDKEDGLVHIAINENKHNEKFIVTDYPGIFSDLNTIVLKYNIYTFKGSYMPDTDIRDGDSWSLSVYYEDDSSDISAHGYMAWPEGFRPAVKAIEDYFKVWRVLAGKGRKVPAEAAAEMFAEIAAGRRTVSYDYETGGYSITTLDEGGDPVRTINYSADGDVLNGVDYNDPLKEF